MSQTKRGSIFEAIANVAIGATISFIAQMLIFPLYGFTPTTQQDFAILGWFTVISIVRSYCLRRVFNRIRRWSVRDA